MEDEAATIEAKYDELAEHWQEIAGGPDKRHILEPAFRSVLPSLSDVDLLDAGCGDGAAAARYAAQGATVVGVDVSDRMIEVARERHGDAATFQTGDLIEGLDFEADSFDVVVCQHVLSHLPDLTAPFAEFARVLRPNGTLAISTHHPFHDFLVARDEAYPNTYEALEMDLDPVVEAAEEPSYHETESFEIYWGGDWDETPTVFYRRPLEALLQPLLDAGFVIERLVEPEPDETFRGEFPALAAELDARPSRSVCLRARLPAA